MGELFRKINCKKSVKELDARSLGRYLTASDYGKAFSFPANKNNQEEFTMAAKVDSSKCVGCEACVGACPVEAIAMKDGKAVVDEGTCIDCGACVGECPAEAISQ